MILTAKRPAARAAGLLAALAFVSASGGTSASAAGNPNEANAIGESSDIRVGFSLSASGQDGAVVAGKDGMFAFTLAAGPTSTPLRGARPAAWLMTAATDQPPDYRACRGLLAGVLSNTTLTPPALDLNAFDILVLSDLPQITVIDPRNGFGGSRLLGLATLDAPGSDWAIARTLDLVAVAEPRADTVAIFDAADWTLRAKIRLPRPDRLVLSPDERLLVVSYHQAADQGPAEDGLAIVDLSQPDATPTRVATGPGQADIAIDDQSHFAFVTAAGADHAWIVDLQAGRIAGSIPTGRQPVAVAYSSLARRAYAGAADGTVSVFGSGIEAVAIQAPPNLTALAVTPGGRFVLAASQEPGQLTVIDSATSRVVQRIPVDGRPDAIGFTAGLVYLRRQGDAYLQTMKLDQIGIADSIPNSQNIAIGQLPLGAAALPARAASIAPVPDGSDLLIASPGEKVIYDYREGMAAASGSFEAYGGEPRAVEVLDRSLREADAGTYRTVGRLPRAGLYTVVFYLDQPRAVQCFPLRVLADPNGPAASRPAPRVSAFNLGAEPHAGKKLPLRFRLTDGATGAAATGVPDVRVVSYRMPGDDRSETRARPDADGFYNTDVFVPQAGIYYVFVDAPSVALAPSRARIINVSP